jgi:hypothetical protein
MASRVLRVKFEQVTGGAKIMKHTVNSMSEFELSLKRSTNLTTFCVAHH